MNGWTEKLFFDEESVMALPHGVVMNEEDKSIREKIKTQAWTSYVKDAFDLTNVI